MNHNLHVNKVMDCISKSSLEKSCNLALKHEKITHGEDLERISVYHLELILSILTFSVSSRSHSYSLPNHSSLPHML